MARVVLEALPAAEAVAFFQAKHDLPSFDWQDLWQREHAAAFTVAKSVGLDILGDIRAAVDEALEGGLTVRDFRKRLEPILAEKGWWGRREVTDPLTGEVKAATLGTPRRLETIYRTNLRTAHAAGQWGRIQRRKARRPWLEYLTVGDERVRESHARWHGLVLPVDDPFWRTHAVPNGWGCRCVMVQRSDRDLERLGLRPGKAPPVETRAWKNRRTGRVERVPVGIDPGWAYNPGAVRGEQLGRVLADKIEAMPEDLARGALRGMLRGPGARWLMAGRTDAVPLPVAVLPPAIGAALGAGRRVPMLSATTAAKQLTRHPDVLVADYALVQWLLDNGEARLESGTHVVVMARIDGEIWQAVIKRTRDGRELYLVSLHRARPRNLRSFRERGELVRDAPGGP
jgi:SPP1 gp7 family putative phage head morphogenesis protein